MLELSQVRFYVFTGVSLFFIAIKAEIARLSSVSVPISRAVFPVNICTQPLQCLPLPPLRTLALWRPPLESVRAPVLCKWDPGKNRTPSFRLNLLDHRDLTSYRTSQDPLVHHGRHFGRAIHAFCNVQTLLLNGLQAMSDDSPEESLTAA